MHIVSKSGKIVASVNEKTKEEPACSHRRERKDWEAFFGRFV
jgi:hypothetical protein